MERKPPPLKRRRIALVLSGGGARGAYEAGALSNLLPRMNRLGMDFDILCATSVGSLNACALAATSHYPGAGGARLRAGILRRAWETINSDKIFTSRYIRALVSFPLHLSNIHGPHFDELVRSQDGFTKRLRRALTPKPYAFSGLLDTSPMQRTLRDGALIDWEQARENIRNGKTEAIALSSTFVNTGETVCFVHARDFKKTRYIPDEHLTLMPVQISAEHAMASAAIPFLFPPVPVPLPDGRRELFIDGGIRMNTPLLPAIQLGADSIIALGLQAPAKSEPTESVSGFDVIPVMGKILNAFFLDKVRTDFDRLQIMNSLINLARPEALATVNLDRKKRGKSALREIRALDLSPSRDIGDLTAEIWEAYPELHRPPLRWMFDARGIKGSALGDLMSYIFFHPAFSRVLLDLGAKDAQRTLPDEALKWLAGLPGGVAPNARRTPESKTDAQGLSEAALRS